MNYTQALATARDEASALARRLHGKALVSDLRSRVALSCFAIAQQHHSGIVLLLSHPLPLHSSAFALLRPLAEATFRGCWIAGCASEEKVRNVLTGDKKQIDTATIVRELQEATGRGNTNVDFYKRVWPQLSAYTHAYENSLDPWLRGQDIAPMFTEEELTSLLHRTSLSAKLIEAGVLSLLAHEESAPKSI